jgi:hypothetical protein
LPVIGGGALLGGWTYRTMWRADTPITGERLVPDKPTTTLITDGPFRYSRNPGYLGAAMVYAGVASLANALWVFLLLPVVLLHDTTHRDRARGMLSGGQVQRGISRIQSTGTPLDLAVLGRRARTCRKAVAARVPLEARTGSTFRQDS